MPRAKNETQFTPGKRGELLQKRITAQTKKALRDKTLAHLPKETVCEMVEALGKALDRAGGNAPLSEKLRGISPQAVGLWLICPLKYVISIEAETGVSRKKLRPDLFLAPDMSLSDREFARRKQQPQE